MFTFALVTTPSKVQNSQQGFTLLELLVVLSVMAIIVGSALLKPPNNESRRLFSAATQLHGYVLSAASDAVRRNENMGIVFQANRAQLLSYSPPDGWQSLDTDNNRLQLLDELLVSQKRLAQLSHQSRLKPDIVLLASGGTAPFEIELGLDTLSGERYTLRSDGLNIELIEP